MTTRWTWTWVQAQFPGLASDWVFFDNAGGSQIVQRRRRTGWQSS